MSKTRMFENLGFLKSKFSIFTIGLHEFIEVGKNPGYPRHPRFRSGRFNRYISVAKSTGESSWLTVSVEDLIFSDNIWQQPL